MDVSPAEFAIADKLQPVAVERRHLRPGRVGAAKASGRRPPLSPSLRGLALTPGQSLKHLPVHCVEALRRNNMLLILLLFTCSSQVVARLYKPQERPPSTPISASAQRKLQDDGCASNHTLGSSL